MENPMTYPMCAQTVTIYRMDKGQICRRVAEGCYYRYSEEINGQTLGRKFLLIQPGEEKIRPGDRIYDGIGPEVSLDAWEDFLPQSVPGLSVAAYATPWHWEGKICHTEAGWK